MINGFSINGLSINGMFSVGAPQTVSIPMEVTLSRSSCRWYVTDDPSTSWADQNTPSTTWMEGSTCE